LSTGTEAAVDFWTRQDRAFSPADQLELLATATAAVLDGQRPQFPLRTAGLLGPDGPAPVESSAQHIAWTAYRDTVRDVVDFMKVGRRVPARVFVGAKAIPPADFLVALASVWTSYAQTGKFPIEAGVDLPKNAELLPARHIAADTPGLFGDWVIHEEGFRAPKILEVARWQAWTLKPALRAQE
jgi:hypothetical protein